MLPAIWVSIVLPIGADFPAIWLLLPPLSLTAL